MALMSPTDSMFLIGESREQPMHVGSLQVFELPDGADTELLRTAMDDMLQQHEVAPLFRRRAYRSLGTLGQWAWADDEDVDLEHHVRHSALPRPARVCCGWPSRRCARRPRRCRARPRGRCSTRGSPGAGATRRSPTRWSGCAWWPSVPA